MGNQTQLEVVVNRNSPDWGTSRVSPAVADKLTHLLTSVSYLSSSNRDLIRSLRGSIDELRELRSTLMKRQARGFVSGPKTSSDGELTTRFGLTRREVQVATLLAQGRSNEAIAKELEISAHTARHHTQRILSKLEVHSRGEAGAKIRNF
jgi:DNA-binding NarL/FixJ family response regulator